MIYEEEEFILTAFQNDEEKLEMLRRNALTESVEEPERFKDKLKVLPEHLLESSLTDYEIPIGVRNDILEVHLDFFSEEFLTQIVELFVFRNRASKLVNEVKRSITLAMSSKSLSLNKKMVFLEGVRMLPEVYKHFVVIFAETLTVEQFSMLDETCSDFQTTKFIQGLIANKSLSNDLKLRTIARTYLNKEQESLTISEYYVHNWILENLIAKQDLDEEELSTIKTMLKSKIKLKSYIAKIALEHPQLSPEDIPESLLEAVIDNMLEGPYSSYTSPEILVHLDTLKNVDRETCFKLVSKRRVINPPSQYTVADLDKYTGFSDEILDWCFEFWLKPKQGFSVITRKEVLESLESVFTHEQRKIYLKHIALSKHFDTYSIGPVNAQPSWWTQTYEETMNQMRRWLMEEDYLKDDLADMYVMLLFKEACING